MRDTSKERIEGHARRQGIAEITLEVAEQGLAEARKAMEEAMRQGKAPGAPSPRPETAPFQDPATGAGIAWSREAEIRLQSIPAGFSRDMTRKAAMEVYGDTKWSPADIDVIELHDCFTSNELITYEALGLCDDGCGGQLVEEGATTYGGDWVVNPSGGLL